MGAGTRAPGGVDDERDRPLLRGVRPAVQEAAVRRTVGALGDLVGVLGVHDHEGADPRDLRHRVGELGRREVGELLHAGVEQEALEAEDAGVVEGCEVGDVARDRAAPEADVDPGLVGGDRPLRLQRRDRGGRRDAVERHVDDRRDAPGSRGAGRAGEALPVGATRLVDVDVGVDESRQQHLVVGQHDHLRTRRRRRRTHRRRRRPRRGARTEADRSAPSTTARPARTRVSGAVSSAMLSCLGRSSSRRGSAAAGRGSARRARRRR